MKRINYKIIIPFFLGSLVLIYACGKNFLNKPPIGVLSPSILRHPGWGTGDLDWRLCWAGWPGVEQFRMGLCGGQLGIWKCGC